MSPVVEQQDWLSLEHQTGDLVSQGKHGYPKVQRDLSSLLHVSQSAQARTSRLRSQEEQAAATRLLAIQGLNGGRCGASASTQRLPDLQDLQDSCCTSNTTCSPVSSNKAESLACQEKESPQPNL